MREILYHPPTRKHTIQCHHPIRKHTIQCHHPIRKHTIQCHHPIRKHIIQYHNRIRKVVKIIHYKYKATPSVKGTLILIRRLICNHSQLIRPLSSLSFLPQKETDLGIGAATGEALADPSSFWFFLQRSATPRAC